MSDEILSPIAPQVSEVFADNLKQYMEQNDISTNGVALRKPILSVFPCHTGGECDGELVRLHFHLRPVTPTHHVTGRKRSPRARGGPHLCYVLGLMR